MPILATALAAACGLCVAGGGPAAERLPQRNLLVELRQGEASSFAAEGGGLERGAVVVGADGSITARAGVTLEARNRDAGRDTVQQVRVLNGGKASVRIGSAVPMQWLQWVWTPQGPGVAVGTEMVETGRGVVVQPRWPGGNAPVTVELRAETAELAPSGFASRAAPSGPPLPEGSIERAGVLTTVQLPLGQWFTVASSGDTVNARERSVVSTRDLDGARRYVVQMRVTAP